MGKTGPTNSAGGSFAFATGERFWCKIAFLELCSHEHLSKDVHVTASAANISPIQALGNKLAFFHFILHSAVQLNKKRKKMMKNSERGALTKSR